MVSGRVDGGSCLQWHPVAYDCLCCDQENVDGGGGEETVSNGIQLHIWQRSSGVKVEREGVMGDGRTAIP